MTLQQFLNSSYTAYHTVANAQGILQKHGFTELTLGSPWHLARGGKYYVIRNGSSIVAFSVGAGNFFSVCESHTDSPAFKVKGSKVATGESANRLNVEKYGGGLWHTFMDRPMKVAGRLITEQADGSLKQTLVASKYNVIMPSVAIHLNPSANESLSLNAQTDMQPLFGQGEQDLYSSLTDEKVVDGDLYVVPAADSFLAGANGEFLCSARLDNLTSVYAQIQALVGCNPCGIAVCACLDNEEVGSGTVQGSPNFINDVLHCICNGLDLNQTEELHARERGLVVSVDNGHGLHPAHSELADPLYKTILNGGIIIKHHVNYSTDGMSAAILKKIMNDAQVKYQESFNKSDVRCGTTLGLATSRALGMKTVDIGIPQLAMHSACETCGLADVEQMQKCLAAVWQSNLLGAE